MPTKNNDEAEVLLDDYHGNKRLSNGTYYTIESDYDSSWITRLKDIITFTEKETFFTHRFCVNLTPEGRKILTDLCNLAAADGIRLTGFTPVFYNVGKGGITRTATFGKWENCTGSSEDRIHLNLQISFEVKL